MLTFVFAEWAPGSFFDALRLDPTIRPERVEALEARYRLDRPVYERCLAWLAAIARGDLGYSLERGLPVAAVLGPRLANTLLLTATATGLAWLAALGLGLWAAARPRGWRRILFGGSTSLLLAIPDLVVALVLLLVAVETGWFPAGGMRSLDHVALAPVARWLDVAHHLVLPVLALVIATAPTLARHVHASLVEVLDAPYVTAARAVGHPPGRVLRRHALRAAARPLVSLAGFSVGGLLSASLVVETILSWPGLGPLALQAALARDPHVVVGAVMASTVLVVAGHLAADLALFRLDPRIRAGSVER